MSRPVDLLYDALGLITTPVGLQFEILGMESKPLDDVTVLSESNLRCKDIFEVMRSVRIHLTPLMNENLYEKLREVGGGGLELNCDELDHFISTVDEKYFDHPTPYLLEQVRDMHAYELALCTFKEEVYYRMAMSYEDNFIMWNKNDVPVVLLTLCRAKHGFSNPKRTYMLYYELFKTLFKATADNILLLTDIVSQPRYDTRGKGLAPAIFWRAFFEALKDSENKPENVVIMENKNIHPETTFYPGLSVGSPGSPGNDFEAIHKLYDLDVSIEIQSAHSNPVDEAFAISDDYKDLKTFVAVFGEPEEILGSRVGGRFNERYPAWPTEWFAYQGTSSLTSLGLVDYEVYPYPSVSVMSSDRDASVLNVQGERIPFPSFAPQKIVIPRIEREASEIRARYLTQIELLEGERSAIKEDINSFLMSQPKNAGLKKQFGPLYIKMKSLERGTEEYSEVVSKINPLLSKAIGNLNPKDREKFDALYAETKRLGKEIEVLELERDSLIEQAASREKERKSSIRIDDIPEMVKDIKTKLETAKNVLNETKETLLNNPLNFPKKKVSFGKPEIRFYEKD